jgi:hypothetical protein
LQEIGPVMTITAYVNGEEAASYDSSHHATFNYADLINPLPNTPTKYNFKVIATAEGYEDSEPAYAWAEIDEYGFMNQSGSGNIPNPGDPPTPEQPYVNASLTTTTLNNDIRFDLSLSYNNSDSYIEGAIAKLVNNNTGTTVVPNHHISLGGNEPDVADTTFLAQDIYDEYEQGTSYTLSVTVYENITSGSIWDTVTATFVWPFNSGGGGGGTTYPDISRTPSATLNSYGNIYVSNYAESEYNNTVSAEITENWYSVNGELMKSSTNEYILEEGYVVDSSNLTLIDFSIENNVEYSIRIGYFNESTGDNYWSDSSRVVREI